MNSINNDVKLDRKNINLLKIQNLDIYSIEYSLLLKKANNKYFLCPYCQKYVPLIFPLIKSNNINLFLYLVCECGKQRIITLKELFSINSVNREETNDFCEICLSNDDKDNILYCLKCNIWICKNCREIVYKDEEKTHNLSKYVIKFNTLCDVHEIYYNLYYCITCKKGICFKCIKKQHKSHEYLSLENYFQNVNDKFKNIYLKNSQKRETDKIVNKVNNNISTLICKKKKEEVIETKKIKNCNKEINKEDIYNIKDNKIKMNIEKIQKQFNKFFNNDISINSNDINEITDYIINYYRLNIQLLYLIKFTYERFLLLEKYNNINIINNMNILTSLNIEEFQLLNILPKNNYEYSMNNNKNEKNKKMELFKEELIKYIPFNPIIKLDGLINFQSYNNFAIIKQSKVKNILSINIIDYLILTDLELLYYSTNENTMYKIEPKYILQTVNFDIIKQYTKKDSDPPFNSKIPSDKINIIIKNNESFDDSLIIKDIHKMKRFSKDISIDLDKINNKGINLFNLNKDNFSTITTKKTYNKKLSAKLNSIFIFNQNISSICKFTDNLILIAYKTNIIKCTFVKFNNEFISINILNIIPAHKKPIYLINLLKNGNVITASEDNTFKIWNITTSKINNRNDKCLYTINKKIFSFCEKITNININIEKNKKNSNNYNNNNYICFGHTKGFYLTINFNWNNMKNIINHKDNVNCMLINNENELITGSLDRYIKKTNLSTFEEDKKVIMENRINAFTIINKNIFAAEIEDIGIFLINTLNLCKIQYIKNWDDKIKSFGSLENGFFYCIINKENENNSDKNQIIKKNDINYNIYIKIEKGYFGNDERFIVFS